MPETCGLRSAPLCPGAAYGFHLILPILCAGRDRGNRLLWVPTVFTIAFWIILALKASNPKIAAKTRPTATSMMVIR